MTCSSGESLIMDGVDDSSKPVGCSSFFFFLFGTTPGAYGGSQARGCIRAIAMGLSHSHSNVGSEQCLRPTPQVTAMLYPEPAERGPGIEHATSW